MNSTWQLITAGTLIFLATFLFRKGEECHAVYGERKYIEAVLHPGERVKKARDSDYLWTVCGITVYRSMEIYRDADTLHTLNRDK